MQVGVAPASRSVNCASTCPSVRPSALSSVTSTWRSRPVSTGWRLPSAQRTTTTGQYRTTATRQHVNTSTRPPGGPDPSAPAGGYRLHCGQQQRHVNTWLEVAVCTVDNTSTRDNSNNNTSTPDIDNTSTPDKNNTREDVPCTVHVCARARVCLCLCVCVFCACVCVWVKQEEGVPCRVSSRVMRSEASCW